MQKQWTWATRMVLAAVLAGFVGVGAGAEEAKADLYPLDSCPVSGAKLDEAVVKEFEGREVRFCCNNCPGGFEGDLTAAFAKLDAQLIEAQADFYPLDVCINSGASLEGREPVQFVIGNRLVKTCCTNCQARVEADPAAFIAKLDEAVIEKQSENYPATDCPVGGELGSMGEPVNMVVGNRLVKLCCAGCERGVKKDPAKHVALIWGGGEEEADASE